MVNIREMEDSLERLKLVLGIIISIIIIIIEIILMLTLIYPLLTYIITGRRFVLSLIIARKFKLNGNIQYTGYEDLFNSSMYSITFNYVYLLGFSSDNQEELEKRLKY